MILHLRNGKRWVIKSRDEGAEIGNMKSGGNPNVYVKSLWVNHKRVDGFLLPHEVIGQGGEMVFEMSRTPGKGWSSGKEGDFDKGGDPEFRVQDLSLSKREVAPHELFWVRFSVRNEGAPGTKIVKLLANGREVGHTNSLVAAGREMVDSIGCGLYPYGMLELRI